MATPSQIQANRRNALKSTGPTSPAGKARSSQNALRHGFASKQIVLNTEDEAAFQALHAEFLDEYQPSSPTERMLVDEVAVAAWRLRRMQSLETVLLDYRFVLEPGFWNPETRRQFDQQDPSWTRFRQVEAFRTGDALESLSRYEGRARRSFYAALTALRRQKNPCRDRAGTVPGAETKPIEAMGRTQSAPAKSVTSRQIGFVLSNASAVPSSPGPERGGPAATLHVDPARRSTSSPSERRSPDGAPAGPFCFAQSEPPFCPSQPPPCGGPADDLQPHWTNEPVPGPIPECQENRPAILAAPAKSGPFPSRRNERRPDRRTHLDRPPGVHFRGRQRQEL